MGLRQPKPVPREIPPAEEEEPPESDEPAEDESKPAWLKGAVRAFSFYPTARQPEEDSVKARRVLLAAGIPCEIAMEAEADPDYPLGYHVMVPCGRYLEAISVLDRDLFNAGLETGWKTHLEMLSDADLCALDEDLMCAGFLDRAKRLKRTFDDELARRGLASRR